MKVFEISNDVVSKINVNLRTFRIYGLVLFLVIISIGIGYNLDDTGKILPANWIKFLAYVFCSWVAFGWPCFVGIIQIRRRLVYKILVEENKTKLFYFDSMQTEIENLHSVQAEKKKDFIFRSFFLSRFTLVDFENLIEEVFILFIDGKKYYLVPSFFEKKEHIYSLIDQIS